MASDLPMPTPTVPKKPFKSFKVISFDIYGTLIDWESSIIQLLQPLVKRIPSSNRASDLYRDSERGESRFRLATHFNKFEAAVQHEQPKLKYDELLTEVYLRIAKDWEIDVNDEIKNEANKFGESVGSWAAFPDTVEACKKLAKHYKLVPLSNVDRDSFSKTCAGPLKGVDFWKVYTAQDIGSYKPDPANFEYLIKNLENDGGFKKDEILHVAQSLFHDHRPAKNAGLSSVWINRAEAGMGFTAEKRHERDEVGYGWRYATLGEFADDVEKEFES